MLLANALGMRIEADGLQLQAHLPQPGYYGADQCLVLRGDILGIGIDELHHFQQLAHGVIQRFQQVIFLDQAPGTGLTQLIDIVYVEGFT